MSSSFNFDRESSEFWDDRAERYHELKSAHDPSLLEWTARPIQRLLFARETPPRALEIGCGTGALTKLIDTGTDTFVACDISTEMVSRAQERLPGLDIRVSDYRELSGDWDVIAARLVLRHQANSRATIRDWMKMLSPHGSLVVADGVPPSSNYLTVDIYERAMVKKHGSWKNTFHSHQVAQWMLDAGASEVEQYERFSYGNSIREWCIAAGVPLPRTSDILDIHRKASEQAKRDYQMEFTENDVLVRYRHCVVVGHLKRNS